MAPAKTGDQQGGRFPPGKSGNPSGRRAGSRNKVTLAMDALLDGEAEELTRKAVELAKAGDIVALRLCLDRISPIRKDRTVTFKLPTLKTVADAPHAMAAIATAMAAGELTPNEASSIAGLVDNFTRAVAASDFEARLAALEKEKKDAA